MAKKNQTSMQILLDLVNKNRKTSDMNAALFQLEKFQIRDVRAHIDDPRYDTEALVAEIGENELGDMRQNWSPIIYSKVSLMELFGQEDLVLNYVDTFTSTVHLLQALNMKYGTALQNYDILDTIVTQDGEWTEAVVMCRPDGPLFRGMIVVRLHDPSKMAVTTEEIERDFMNVWTPGTQEPEPDQTASSEAVESIADEVQQEDGTQPG